MKISKMLIGVAMTIAVIGCSDKPTLEIYSWSDYIDPEVIQRFEQENNCNVNVTSFDSNEAMYAKLKAGAAGYDLLIPSSYIIPLLVRENIIRPLDHDLLPTVLKNIDHGFDNQIIDSSLEFSVPYLITYTGIMYNKKYSDGDSMSWKVFSEEKYRGKFSMLDDMREVIGIGLMYNGYSVNSEDESEIEDAVSTILEWRNNVRKFDAESYKTEVSNGSIYFGHGYSSDAFQVMFGDGETEGRNDIGFALPKEGFSIACDEFVITRSSKNSVLAHKFIDFVYEDDNSIASMTYNVSPMPNKSSILKLDDNMRKLIIIDKNTMKRGQVLKQFNNKDTHELYNSAWDKIRSIKK